MVEAEEDIMSARFDFERKGNAKKPQWPLDDSRPRRRPHALPAHLSRLSLFSSTFPAQGRLFSRCIVEGHGDVAPSEAEKNVRERLYL